MQHLGFHALPCLTNGDVADILQIACTRILRLLRRKGVVEDDAVNVDETLCDPDPALAELAVASTLGRIPAGPALRQKDPIPLRPGRDLAHPKGLCAAVHGFSLHAATTAKADDPVGREALCKYILRPPIAQENIQQSDDLVCLQLKRPFSDGTFALDLDPLSLLVRLATTVPPPRFHSVRYAGVLAAAGKWRARVVPPAKTPIESDDAQDTCSSCSPKDKPRTHRSGYRPWRELLMRSFKTLVMTSAGIERYLNWLGEPEGHSPQFDNPRGCRFPSEGQADPPWAEVWLRGTDRVVITVRRVQPDDWRMLRALRLAALADAPEAFEATLEEERAFEDERWIERARSNAEGLASLGLMAYEGDTACGLVVGVWLAADPPSVELNALWVAPEARGTGAAEALVEAVGAWATDRGAHEVTLAVTERSLRARALYERMGFVTTPTAETCGARAAPAVRMRLAVTRKAPHPRR